ncbi:hypothetical protein [Nannocystis radixulma]|uniref:Uncharacterized protein n=1 Tax=Nannocystis radixulma TaxID=2995305 RepID=A0ABT5BA68_9BACT|nr:hypothetical protein [Nannocystis radixulma]MDC0671030.1 hypothetical protein [Nannocystis radixulma]
MNIRRSLSGAALLLVLLPTGCGDSTSAGTDSDTTTGAPEEPPVELDASGCVPKCVEDVNAATITKIEADCEVCDHPSGQETCEPLVECREELGWLKLPEGETACFSFRFDDSFITPSELDDLSQACSDLGTNAEYFILRAGEAPAGTTVTVSCTWSPDPAMDCPML